MHPSCTNTKKELVTGFSGGNSPSTGKTKLTRERTRDKILNDHRRREYLYQMSSSFSKIYGQIKTHRTGHPIRPVVAFYSGPTFNSANYLVDWFRCMSQFEPTHTVKNFFELASRLKDIKLPASAKLLSLDVTSMFTRILVVRTITYMEDLLKEKNIPQETIKEFKDLLQHCVENNSCAFSAAL